MASVVGVLVDALVWLFSQLYISMTPVGDVGDLSLGFGDGGDISPSPMADIFPPPPPSTQMSASYLFKRILTDKGMLINVLAVVSAVLIGFQALLGSRRRRFGSNPAVRLPLWLFYTVSFPLVSYTIGLVQSVEAKVMPDSQLLWVVALLLLLGSVNGLSAFSRQDIEQSKGIMANHVLKTLLVLWLLLSRTDISTRWVLLAYFLLCWIYSIFRMAQRMMALRMASSAHGLVRSAVVVADYMKDIVKDKEHDPKNLSKCKYLVHGEEKDFIPPSADVGPPYLTKVGSKVVTLDKIWNDDHKLLRSGRKWDSAWALKHTCLSFALFKLLKRRFCRHLDIAEAGDPKAMEFVVDGLLADNALEGYDYERAFHVVELELSFLYDFFYTKYPVLFPANRLLGLIRFFVLVGFVKVLLFDFLFVESLIVDDAPENTFIFFNNVLLLVMILSIDMLQHLGTGYSNWGVVLFVCDYVKAPTGGMKRCWKRGLGIRRALIKLVAAWRWQTGNKWWSPRCWDNKLGQYSLLKSYDYNPSSKNALSLLSMRMMERTGQGRREEKAVPLTADVKKEVLDTLKTTRGLPYVGHSLKKSRAHPQLHWACDDLPSHTHTVLVWHIATTMCEIRDTDSDRDDSVEHGGIPVTGSNEHGHRHIATTLSRYCAYLLAFVPDMLPDNSYKAMQILDAVVDEAQVLLIGLRDSKDMQERCQKMFELAGEKKPSSSQIQDEQPSPEPEDVKDTKILMLGARLGLQLRQSLKKRSERWAPLAKFWAELVLFLAPSNNADVHAESLATGGEFITHLWTLLTHAGIVERPRLASPV